MITPPIQDDLERRLFDGALEQPAGPSRDAWLAEACGGDAALALRIQTLLRAHAEETAFLPATMPAALTTPAEQAGERIGRYKLLQPLGEGGMGSVWMAEQREPMVRRVALKIIKLGMDTQEVVARFEQERQALALMDHPCIARVFDAGTTESGRPFFVMELVRGVPLNAYCDDQKLGVRERLALFIQVCQAIQHAHQKGIIHRDLKPSNILVTAGDDGEPLPKVIDFGIAKATGQALTDRTLFTQLAQIIGTPAYMSPEQAGMGPLDIDTRSDIYSLGVLLYELLTGRPPFDPRELISAGLDEMRRVIREKEPPKPSTRISSLTEKELTGLAAHCSSPAPRIAAAVRGDLDWIVMKALDKNRNRRYESATGLAADIQRHLENQPVLARPPGRAYLFSRFVRRHKFGFAAGAAVSLALVGGITAAMWGLLRAETARKEAKDEATKATAANVENKKNLHLASMADLASALHACKECFAAEQKGERAIGFAGKSRWCQVAALLTRSLEREPENHRSALWLYEILRHRPSWRRDYPEQLFNHEAPVMHAVFSQDNTRVVTASTDKTARVWDAATGHAFGEPMLHHDGVNSASFSPDGTKVVTASDDNTARVWGAATGHALGGPMLHDSDVNTGSFSPDGTMIVTTSDENTARVWDTAAGHALGEPMRHDDGVNTARFSPEGARVVTASYDGTARIWGMPLKDGFHANSDITPGILAWAKSLAGLCFSEDGEFQVIPDEVRIAAMAKPTLPPGPWADLARWINTPAPQRTIDVMSKFSLRQIAERERDFNGAGSVMSLISALQYDPTVPLARLFLAAAMERGNEDPEAKARNPHVPQFAATLRRYDLDALAREEGKMKKEELAALWVRAAKHLLELPPETKIGVGPKPTTARDEALKAAHRAAALTPGDAAVRELLQEAQPAPR